MLTAIQGFASLLAFIESPLATVRTMTDILAGQKRGEKKVLVNLPLFLTKEQFDKVIQHPDIKRGYAEAALLEKSGTLRRCASCGGVCRE
jgi:hypothetical protein